MNFPLETRLVISPADVVLIALAPLRTYSPGRMIKQEPRRGAVCSENIPAGPFESEGGVGRHFSDYFVLLLKSEPKN